MDRLGILFLTNFLPIGGFETHLLSIVRALDKTAFHPVLCCLKEGGPLASEFSAAGVPVYERIQAHRFDPLGIPRLIRIMKRERIHLLDTDLQRNTVFLGTLAARLAGVKARLISCHVVSRQDGSPVVGWPARISMGGIDLVIALFEEHRRQLTEDEGLAPEKITILWNGVDMEEYQPRPPREGLRRELGIPEDSPVVAIVASLYALKAHEVFLQVAARVLERHPRARFLVVGEGPERARLEKLAEEKNLDRAVQFLGRRRDMPDLLTIMDVNVLTSLWEAAPISTLEAMACEIPTVATRVGALPEMIVDGETGFLLDIGDEEGIAAAVNRLLDDPTFRRRVGVASRRRIRDLYSIEKIVREREAMYRRLLESKRGLQPAATGP